jgi:hypothetical protein
MFVHTCECVYDHACVVLCDWFCVLMKDVAAGSQQRTSFGHSQNGPVELQRTISSSSKLRHFFLSMESKETAV